MPDVGLAPGSALDEAMRATAQDVDALFDAILHVPDDPRAVLYEAMRHAAIGGGKRLRPMLVRAAATLFNVEPESALRTGLAIECVHVYSLIHDDMPCMDDDDMRRGKPTVHRQFGEAVAVLAGDSLHALAFELIADPATHPDPFVRAELAFELGRASGPTGMAGGQMMDLIAEERAFDLPTTTRLQQMKTGALIAVCLEAGAILGHIPESGRRPLRAFARDIGLAFQIADDLLDVEGDAAVVGKATGKDAGAGKATFVSLLGVDRARAQSRMLIEQAIAHLGQYGPEADLLRDIARYIIARDH